MPIRIREIDSDASTTSPIEMKRYMSVLEKDIIDEEHSQSSDDLEVPFEQNTIDQDEIKSPDFHPASSVH